ncbi:hypothetical protein NT6N_26550 [Oceaniferula spumae]|uniref:Uncharacterized protein n=1 Tax=Oceaniferula spumae TaxID=2979115 RepID=A0AAT9FNM2_9BACT
MKLKKSFSITSQIFLLASLLAVVGFSATNTYAGPPSAVTKSKSAATILVKVPEGGKAVTYTLGGKTWKVEPGQSAVLPIGATKIHLPAGTILIASIPSAKSMAPVEYPYTVKNPITLDALTPEAIAANSDSIVPGTLPTRNPLLPSPTLRDLIDAVNSAGTNTVNPTNVMGDEVTDGNQP